MNPGPQTTLQKGLAFHQAGRIGEARRCYDEVLRSEPGNADAHHLLGVLLVSLGQAGEGVVHLRLALKHREDFVQAYVSLGHGLVALHDAKGAAGAYGEALGRDPKHLEALCHLGRLMQEERRGEEALALYRRALEVRPNFPEVLLNMGNLHLLAGAAKEALACYHDAASQRPAYAEAWSGAGSALLALKRPDEALASASQAVSLKTLYPEGHNNRGNALLALDRLEEAEAAFRLAVSQRSGYAEALSNLGNVLLAQGRHLDACAAYESALAANPELPDAAYNLGLAELALGQFESGWRRYELRWKSEMKVWVREWQAPQWDGVSGRAGETMLVYAEQGLGDTLQFCRYLPLLLQRGFRLVFEVQAPLASLMRHSFPEVEVVKRGDPLRDAQWRTPLLSLPHLLHTTLATIPKPAAYLVPRPEAVEEWKGRLGSGKKLRVGVVWSGNPKHKNDRNRSLSPALLPGVFEGLDVAVFGLQKELREEDAKVLRGWVHAGPDFIDFLDTAAAVCALDLVVTVDTSVAHLAGALGKPVWNLLPFAADWRWMVGRQDSPWYPSMRLFRQVAPQAWGPLLQSLRESLRVAVDTGRFSPRD